jgi:hypothetical protein
MGKYGKAAIRATELVREGLSPPAAWEHAARELFAGKDAAQRKGCPKGTYLGLCEEGRVVGVPGGSYTRSADNKAYGLEAIRLLTADPTLADTGAASLWDRVMAGREKRSNSQMDVVLALWSGGLINRRP